MYNFDQFQWLMYRPLYMFGNNTNGSVAINYPLSPASAPVYSNGGKTVKVPMKGWKWSNGATVDAKSLIFYMNMVEAEKANWYATTPGLLPDNVTSYKATGPNEVTFQLNKAYSSLWFTYNQLAELTPMPAAWDVTSLGAKPGSGGCITDSKAADNWAKCKAVYTFLTSESKKAASYASSPLWSVVNGPWKLSAFSTSGNVTMVPNKAYSGSPKPKLAASSSCRLRRTDRVHRAKDRAGGHGLHPVRGPAAEAGPARCLRAIRWAATTPCSPSTRSASSTASPTSITRRWASWSGSSTCARPCRWCSISPASSRRSTAGTPSRLGAGPEHAAGEPVAAVHSDPEQRPGPVPV